MRSGFVSLIGRPNVGKSTLLNTIIGSKIAITSSKPQTTRNNIQGIYNTEDIQIVFVDTPGIHKPQNKLGKYLNKEAYYSINDVDVILFIIDISENIGPGDKFIIEYLKTIDKPVLLIINKIDKLPKEQILLKIDQYKDLYNFEEIIPLSALKKDNVDRLISTLTKYLKDNIKYFSEGEITSYSKEFLLSEIIREKVLLLTEDEVPHSTTCIIEKIEEEKDIVNINGTIVVDRDNLKRIIIGKQGQMIKEIGTNARIDMEQQLGKKVYLELFVKVIPKWRDKEKYLKELGYNIKNFE